MKLWIPKKYYVGVYLRTFTWNVRIYMTGIRWCFSHPKMFGDMSEEVQDSFFRHWSYLYLHSKFTFSTLYGHNSEKGEEKYRVNRYDIDLFLDGLCSAYLFFALAPTPK